MSRFSSARPAVLSPLKFSLQMTAVITLLWFSAAAHAQSKFDAINAHTHTAIAKLSGMSNDGTMSIALASLVDAPASKETRDILKFVEDFRRAGNFEIDDYFSEDLVRELAKRNVLLTDPGFREGPLFQEVVKRRELDSASLAGLRDLFNDPAADPGELIYVSDTSCGQDRVAGITLGSVGVVCGDTDSLNRSRQIAAHEAAHVVIHAKFDRFRGYSMLVDAAQSIFGDIKVHSKQHINEFFGLAAEILSGSESVWRSTLHDMVDLELHHVDSLPEFAPSNYHAHSLGYAVYYSALKELEALHGVKGKDSIRDIVRDSLEGPLRVNQSETRERIDRYIDNNITATWQTHIKDAYRKPAHHILAWLESSRPDPRIGKGDKLYAAGDGPGAIKAWSEVTGQARGEALDSIRLLYAWGGRGVEADESKAVEWHLKAIQAGDGFAASSTIHVDDEHLMVFLSALEDAIRLRGKSVELLGGRAQMYQRLGMYELAEADLEEARKMHPGEPGGKNVLGYFLAETDRRIPYAISLLLEAHETTHGRDPYIMDSVGWAFYKQGELDEARRFLEASLDLLRNDQAVSAHLGEVLWKLGEKDKAREIWNRVNRDTPTANYENRLLKETIRRLTGTAQ